MRDRGPAASPWPENLGALGASPRDGAARPRRRGAGADRRARDGTRRRNLHGNDRTNERPPAGLQARAVPRSSACSARGRWASSTSPTIRTIERPRARSRRSGPKPRAATTPPEIEARFLKEARLAGRLQHPNIVTVYDVGRDGDVYFIAMEYVEGRPLTRYLAARRRAAAPARVDDRPPGRRGARRTRTSAASSTATSSPATSSSAKDGRVKVTDFGIGKFLGGRAVGPDAHGPDDRKPRLHVARAGRGREARRPLGPLLPRASCSTSC